MFFCFLLFAFCFFNYSRTLFSISLWSVVLICPQYWASSSGESNSMYRLGHSGTFACHNCKQKGDKWFMQKHLCKKSEWQAKFIATFNYDHIDGNFAKLHPEYASSPSVFHIIFPFFLHKKLTFYLEIILCGYWEGSGHPWVLWSSLFSFIHCLFPLSSADSDCIQKERKLSTLSPPYFINIKKCPMMS